MLYLLLLLLLITGFHKHRQEPINKASHDTTVRNTPSVASPKPHSVLASSWKQPARYQAETTLHFPRRLQEVEPGERLKVEPAGPDGARGLQEVNRKSKHMKLHPSRTAGEQSRDKHNPSASRRFRLCQQIHKYVKYQKNSGCSLFHIQMKLGHVFYREFSCLLLFLFQTYRKTGRKQQGSAKLWLVTDLRAVSPKSQLQTDQ